MKKIFFFVATLFICQQIFAQKLPYKNPSLPSEERAKDLLSRMTLDEKVAQLQCSWLIGKLKNVTNGKFDAKKAAVNWKDGLGQIAHPNEDLGITSREQFGQTLPPRQGAEQFNEIQKYFVEQTRLGIPVMAHEEILHGLQARHGTNFPMPLALASSWDETLFNDVYTVAAQEARSRGASLALGPVLDIVRDPRWGRTDETMGEDTYYNAHMGKIMVDALQGPSWMIGDNHVGVTLKHFGVHGDSEGGVNTAPSFVDEHEARQSFLLPFQYVIKHCNPTAIMITYNELWGTPAHANIHLLKDILRDEYGFKGTVVSDYTGISNLYDNDHSSPSYDAAGTRALKAGIDMELPDIKSFKNLSKLVADVLVSVNDIDRAVYNVLLVKFRLGLFEHPYVDPDKAEKLNGNDDHRKLAYKAATESMVLLQNNGNLLPLDKDKIKTIAIIGPNADKCILGGYSDVPKDTISPLRAIREKYGKKMNILYAEGVRLLKSEAGAASIHFGSFKPCSPEENAQRIKNAVEIAKKADAVVLFLGENDLMSHEGLSSQAPGDLPDLSLLAGQKELVDQITALGKPVCAFVNSGTTLSLGELESKVPAVMQCWYLGQEGGYAMVDALFGDVNPSGKLTISFPRAAGFIPAYYNYKPSSRRGYNLGFDIKPLHPFGFGLSYTTFAYSNLKIDKTSMSDHDTATVSVDVQNTGNRDGAEIVQMYITDDYATLTRPIKELRGFKRVNLKVGEKQTVTFNIGKDELAYYDTDNKWQVEPGTFTIAAGASSDNNESVKLEIK